MTNANPDPHDGELLACHDCDALFRAPHTEPGDRVTCPQCAATLYQNRPNAVHRAAAFAISAASLFVVANAFPFIELRAGGQVSRIVLAQSVSALQAHGSPELAVAVAIFILAAPCFIICGMLYLLIPLLTGRRLPGAMIVCRWVFGSHAWNMIEVFLLGVLVSLLKLGDIATVRLGISFWAFSALILCVVASLWAINRHQLWNQLEEAHA